VKRPDGAVLEVSVEVQRRAMRVQATFELAAGERLALYGPSGAGKTTVLEAIAGLAPLSQGAVRIDGRLVAGRCGREPAVAPRARRVGIVRQPTTTFPHLTVRENLAYGARRRGPSVEGLLEQLGLAELRDARPYELSGGQRQRVALGRALACDYRTLLLDEPFSAVDVATRRGLRRFAVEHASKRGAASILVTHDLAEAQAFGERLGIVDQGQVLQLGEAHDVVRRPATRRVAELLGYEGFTPVDSVRDDRLLALHPDRVVPGAIMDHGVVLEGTVVAAEALGPRYAWLIVLARGGTCVVHADDPVESGRRVTVTALDPPLVAAVDSDG
jgi:molybdate transport system ATP-binding protein